MLAYAPDRRTRGALNRSPKTLALVAIGHVVVVGIALTTKMTIDYYHPEPPLVLVPIRPAPPPDPQPMPRPDPHRPANQSHITTTDLQLPLPPIDTGPIVDPGPSLPLGPISGTSLDPVTVVPPVKADPVRIAARFNTPDSMLRPPYPTDKLRLQEETTLQLRLTIDANGRVTAVEPIGRADPSFLEAARRHILRNWRYKPATVDGATTGSTTVINLSFRLEDA